ncbi:hypothetical protein [Cellulosimicrobium sp. CpK407]|uniref:hypothetical protein n=1 Tax=Cellulosimicrobium sp. CpK407 TaxID=3229847 RepID=UPI003F2CD819
MSVIFEAALDQYRACREAFEDYREGQYRRALDELGGVLLNRDGQRERVDTYSLFIGSHQRADRWASEELRGWWARHGRMTYAEFERQYVEQMWGEAA